MAVIATSNSRFRHLALFYRGQREYVGVLCDFIRASRARGDAVLVAVPQHQAQWVRRELG